MIVSDNVRQAWQTKCMNDSPDMIPETYLKHRAEQVTSGPMAGHHGTPWWPDVRGRVAMSPPPSKLDTYLEQLEGAGFRYVIDKRLRGLVGGKN